MDNYLLFSKPDWKITLFSGFVIILIIAMLFISFFYKFNFHFSYNGLVLCEEGRFYVSIILSDNEFKKVKKSFLVVDKKTVLYHIYKIDGGYVLTDSGPKRLVYMEFDFNDDEKIVNNVIPLIFVYRDTLFNKLKEMF